MNNNKKNNENKINELEKKKLEDTSVEQISLDDERRIKVVSPAALVAKRFFRNKLAIIGLIVLIFMFAFCFIGGWISPYKQTQVFHKRDSIIFDYGSAKINTEYDNFFVFDKSTIDSDVYIRMDSYAKEMEINNESQKTVYSMADEEYTIKKLNDGIYTLIKDMNETVAFYITKVLSGSYFRLDNIFVAEESVENESEFKAKIKSSIESKIYEFTHLGVDYLVKEGSGKNIFDVFKKLPLGRFDYSSANLGSTFETSVKDNLNADSFALEDKTYLVKKTNQGYEIKLKLGLVETLYATKLNLHRYDVEKDIDDSLKVSVFAALSHAEPGFVYEGKNYSIVRNDKNITITCEVDGININMFKVSMLSANRYDGKDTLSIDFKDSLYQKMLSMDANGETESVFTYLTDEVDENGNIVLDENGVLKQSKSEFEIKKQLSHFNLRNYQVKDLINIYEPPSKQHVLGTDANGMDVMTRIMHGGRISLLVGFIVIFLSLFIGVILGGIAGYFGGWVDNVIMRIVDIFYCIPTMPILIITGALFDSLQLKPTIRIMYLMVMLGVLGWAGIARLVRGQILSLREQEFMIATEATGIKATRRIFRHLIPNVMPQLIVNATMGLGSIIITESTLSFLGLGAKYPLATWGAMINSVSSINAMIAYAYIWIPVGILICLTVIAFNFVGDGLRDAFDPKMKR